MGEPLAIAINAAQSAGAIAKTLLGRIDSRNKNSTYNLVTQADIDAESSIVSTIQRNMPGSTILSEESHWDQNVMAEKLWIIDPLDGTNNYAHSIPHFSISIAYAEYGAVKIAVVYDPLRDELFSAELGKGAFLNGEKIKVSDVTQLQDSIIATGFYYDRGELMQNTLFAVYKLFNTDIQGIRRMGSAALDLSWTAAGRYEGYFEYMLSPWDFAAGMLLVREAGGVVCDRNGNQMDLKSKGIICSNKKICEQFIDVVRWDTISNLNVLNIR